MKMKTKLMSEIAKAMSEITEHTDGNSAAYVTREISNVLEDIETALSRFDFLKYVVSDIEELFNPYIWEDCCEEDPDFEDIVKTLLEIEKVFD